ncbi:hypothetical protein HW115_18390 [Verrucomicrobiaceae bacterium N1E253]|uniref:Sortilin N-terminal domain-containing protein n=1 Tax=Oceaniferula marina TaxID=2748318 RepID=A0A851GTH4_9BACT|nr:LamG-like jellyroll fold domain-containing protein [Oceaniferula marina]NWK57594.1 hypothetical protein [Oceaniferula marina]
MKNNRSKLSLFTQWLAAAIASASLCHAESEKESTNQKDRGALEEYNQELRDRGWHRKEANALTDALADTFGDDLLLPLPAPDQFVTKLFAGYQADYAKFEKDFPNASIPLPKGSPSKAGVWSRIYMNPTGGRIYDLELNPKNPDEIYANPDGDGIYFTKNGGKNWHVITDTIPTRLHRNCAENIIVDPRDFRHVFSISHYGRMYETKDQGATWSLVINTANQQGNVPQFKWVEAFRDRKNKLVIIGVVTKGSGRNGGWKPGVYRTENTGKTWQRIAVEGDKLQEMAFHKKNPDIVYLAGRSKLFISKNAGKSFSLLKDFKTGDRPMFITTLYGADADGLYVAVSTGRDTQVHFSKNKGRNWQLRQDSAKKVGHEKGIFGNDGSSGWTSFFEVDPFDPKHLMASSVGNCESFDGGVTWNYFSWGKRANAIMPDGSVIPSPHAGHNADNHVLKFHPAKRGFRVKGCDGGIMAKWEDKAANWTNISGDMPAFLWFSIIVNEFGDRYIAGNTQDLNVQTYRYGVWENEIGYEGDAIFINPYSNVTYYPCSPTEKGEGLNFLEPGNWKMHSWNMPKSTVNYSNPDQFFVAFGRRETSKSKQLPKFLYQSNNRGVSYDRVPNLDKPVFAMNVSRTDAPILTIFTATSVMATSDWGQNWQTHPYPKTFKASGGTRKVSGAVDPNNPKRLWLGGKDGKVFFSNNGGASWQDLSGTLPKGEVSELILHEGTGGDLYALINGYGVFYKAADSNDWSFWMDGFDLRDFKEIRIDYPQQKMVAASYGRGAWEAPLMTPCERFYPKGFAIKQLNELADIKVFGIDSPLVTPDYYNYHWTINGKPQGSNTPMLVSKNCKPGDTVELTLKPKHTTGIETRSKALKAIALKDNFGEGKAKPVAIDKSYIDLGMLELFGAKQDLTFEATVKLSQAGVVAGNRRKFFRDAKGWYLDVNKDGELSLHLSPRQNGNFSRTYKRPKDQALVITSPKKSVPFEESVQLAFSISAQGLATLFVNGDSVGQAEIDPADRDYSLNSVLSTTVFADPFGKHGSSGEIENIRVWHKLLTGEELKANRIKLSSPDGLVYFILFNDADPVEMLTRKPVVIKPDTM